jgi:hypothetical protein
LEAECSGTACCSLQLRSPFHNLTLEHQVYTKVLGLFPDRIKNLYFSYLFLLRAVNKVMALAAFN